MQHGALEKDIAPAVIAEQVVEALLGEDDQGVETARGQLLPGRGHTPFILVVRERAYG